MRHESHGNGMCSYNVYSRLLLTFNFFNFSFDVSTLSIYSYGACMW